MTIDGDQHVAGGARFDVVAPHDHGHVLGTGANATREDAKGAVEAALRAAPAWRALPFDERAAILLRAADLLAGPWRDRLNAATMLGQSKTCYQAEIDSACELADFWRFNVAFGRQLQENQPMSGPGVWNRVDYRPLEGFVYAITPFNFTAIAGNLPTAPALMGNTVIWKPSPTQSLAAHLTMRLLEEAGMPPGVINLLTGDGREVSEVLLADPALAGIHFTGSSATFQHLWQQVGQQHRRLRELPAAGRRDRRQGLRARPPERRRRRAAHRAGPRRVRVPGPEVLGRVPRVRAALAVGQAARRPGRRGQRADHGRRRRLRQLHGRGDRQAGVRQAGRRPAAGPRPSWR